MPAEHPFSKIPPDLVQLLHKAAKVDFWLLPSQWDFRKDVHHDMTKTEKLQTELAAGVKTEKPLINLAGVPISPEDPK